MRASIRFSRHLVYFVLGLKHCLEKLSPNRLHKYLNAMRLSWARGQGEIESNPPDTTVDLLDPVESAGTQRIQR